MICSMCNENEAVLLVQQVSFNGKKQIHLCPSCAQNRGIDVAKSSVGTSIEKLVNSIGMDKKACYVCGKTFDDIQKTGLMGCPECYVSFTNEVKNIIEQRGLETPYLGSMPKKVANFRSILTDRIEIKKKLDASIEHEDFEKAAKYRDFLLALERSAIASAEDEGDFFDK